MPEDYARAVVVVAVESAGAAGAWLALATPRCCPWLWRREDRAPWAGGRPLDRRMAMGKRWRVLGLWLGYRVLAVRPRMRMSRACAAVWKGPAAGRADEQAAMRWCGWPAKRLGGLEATRTAVVVTNKKRDGRDAMDGMWMGWMEKKAVHGERVCADGREDKIASCDLSMSAVAYHTACICT